MDQDVAFSTFQHKKKSRFFDMNPCDRLKIVRKQLSLTQEKLAKSVGLRRINITDLESGKVKISTIHALALEHVWKIRAEWLLDGTGEMMVEEKPEAAVKNLASSSERPVRVRFDDDPEIDSLLLDAHRVLKEADPGFVVMLKSSIQTAAATLPEVTAVDGTRVGRKRA